MKLRRMIKQKARAALRGNRGSAVALLLICMGVSVIINLVDAAALQLLGYEFSIYSVPDVFTYSDNFFYSLPAMGISLATWLVRLALVVPLGYGLLNWHLELTDRRKQGVLHIFWPYEGKGAIRGILLSINILVKMTLTACILLVLPISVIFAGDLPGLSRPLSMTLISSGIILTLAALLLLFAFYQRFAMAGMLICEKYQLTVHQAVKTSVRFTKGHRWELVRFELSFLPWLLPLLGTGCMLVFSVTMDHYSLMPFVWVWVFLLTAIATYLLLAPYYTMAQAMYTRYLYEYGLWRQEPHTAPVEAPLEAPGEQTVVEPTPQEALKEPVAASNSGETAPQEQPCQPEQRWENTPTTQDYQ